MERHRFFFDRELAEFHKGFANLLNLDNRQDDTAGEGGTDGEPEGQGYSAFVYYSLVDTVSETLREPWSEVWEKNIYEFFNIIAYTKDKRAREKAEMEKWQKSH